MKQQIQIRTMVSSDLEAVTSIYAEVLHPDYISFSELAEGKAEYISKLSPQAVDIFREQLIMYIDSNKHGFFIAEIDNQTAGFVLTSLHLTEANHYECWIDDVCVGSHWQKNGIGTALIKQALHWGKQNNARYFLLESGIKNSNAHLLFEHLGFQPLATVFWHDLSDTPQAPTDLL